MARKLATTPKRWLLSAHILLSGAWLGTSFCFLVLSIVARSTHDRNLLLATYMSIDVLDRILVRPMAIGAAVSGILLSVLTQWGLFRFNWIIAKLILTVLLIASGVIIFGLTRVPRSIISIISSAGLQALQNPSYQSNQTLLLIYVIAEVVFLSASVAVSVFKPAGLRTLTAVSDLGKGAKNMQ